jgi:hypothetical protein
MRKFGSQIINISSVVAQTGSIVAMNCPTSRADLEGPIGSLGRESTTKGIICKRNSELGFLDIGIACAMEA